MGNKLIIKTYLQLLYIQIQMKIRSSIIVFVLFSLISLWVFLSYNDNKTEYTFTISKENSLNQYVKPFKFDTNFNYQTPILIGDYWWEYLEEWKGKENCIEDIKDFNKDGIKDTLYYYEDGGSGFDGNYVLLENGKTHDRFCIDDEDCICSVLKVVPIPYELLTSKNKPFLKAMEKCLFEKNNFSKKMPDASLEWLITAYRNHNKTDGKFIEEVYRVPVKWYKGKLTLTGNYYFPIQGEFFTQSYNHSSGGPDWLKKDSFNQGWMLYYGNCNDSLYFDKQYKDLSIYHTHNGIVLKKEDAYSWMFQNDYNLTGGNNKCWEAIDHVNTYDDYIIFTRHNWAASVFFIIDIKTGITGKLKIATYSEEKFKTLQDSLIYKDISTRKVMAVSIIEIINELKKS